MLNPKNFNLIKGRLALALLFYGAITTVVLKTALPPVPAVPSILMQDYLSGEQKAFNVLGAEFGAYKKMLPPEGPVTFIMNVPFSPYATGIAKLYEAQSYFTPLILDPKPNQKAAILYCDNHFIADMRMQQDGYQLVAVAGDGKGMAVKKA